MIHLDGVRAGGDRRPDCIFNPHDSRRMEDGVVKTLNVEQPGKFEVSNADTMLKQV